MRRVNKWVLGYYVSDFLIRGGGEGGGEGVPGGQFPVGGSPGVGQFHKHLKNNFNTESEIPSMTGNDAS